MRLNVALIACSLATSAFADPQPREPARARGATAARAPDPAPPLGMVVAHQMRARADSLRKQGDYEAALDAYQSEMAVEGETADCWKHIGWTQRALRRYADAEASLRRASELDPNDREAQDDLDGLHLSRGLRLDARMGGSEPGTSKNAFEGELVYGGFNRVELHAGGSWTDNIFYDAIKGYANAYWFYSPDSYLKADFTLRRYNYTAANTAALLRDPDPATTLIAGRPVPGAPPGTVCPTAGQPSCATATNVKFRSEFLLGGSLSYQADLWGIGVKYIPNRDLDSGFDWSIISSLDLRPLEKLSFDFQWVLDRYSNSSGPLFAGQNGNIWWATVRYQLTRPLALGAGVKWVANPSPADVNTTSTRNDPTFLLNIDYRTVLF